MDKRHIVKKSLDFSNIIHNCSYVKNKSFIIYYNKDNGVGNYRFGISASKKLGNAVYRNKYKRQVRFIIDKYKKYYQNSFDYIIIIRNGYVGLDFKSNDENYISLIEMINDKNKE